MRPKLRVLVAGGLALVVLGACGSDSDESSTTTEAPPDAAVTTVAPEGSSDTTVAPDVTTAPAQPTGDIVVAKGSTSLGDTLVDKNGLTLYQFDNDKDGVIACTASCTSIWPPVTIPADDVIIGEGLDAAKFATVTRDDGTKQVTVDGHPLYRFAADVKAGDIGGQKLGNVWWVTGLNGEKLG